MSQEIRRRIAARRRGTVSAEEAAFPRYSRGAERLPEDTEEKLHVGRFSEGHEALADDAEKEHVGRFSEGHEARPDEAPEKEHVGRFADGAA